MSMEASSVEDPEGAGDDPGGGHEPSVDPEVGDGPIVVVVFVVVLVQLCFEFQFVLSELLFAFLLYEAPPVRAEGAGTRGEGDLGVGQPHVQVHLVPLGEVQQLARQLVQGGRGRRLRIQQFHKLEFFKAEVNVLVDEFSFSDIVAILGKFSLAEIVVLLDDFLLLLP